MKNQKILLIGAGAVGTLVGAKLAFSGADVVFWSRHPEDCEQMNRRGVAFLENGREFRGGVRAYPDPAELFAKEENVSLAILAVKSFSTRSALLTLAPYLHRIDQVMTLGNGLGNEEALFDYVPPSKMIAGTLTIACSLASPGVAESENKGGIALAPVSLEVALSDCVRLFRKAAFRVKICSDWKSMKWSKLLLNMTANATCAILDMSMGEVFENPRTFNLERRLALETASVMKSLGLKPVALPRQPVPLYLWGIKYLPESVLKRMFGRKMRRGRGKKLASLHLDFRQGKKETEWPFLYGAVLGKAREKGITVPVLETLCRILDDLSAGKMSRETFRRNPKALEDAVMKEVSGTGP